ncbi:hypothetical protein CSW58_03110 [Caulobacter sp. B11]|nr:hypothetical protein CSW58_03110 [Caulobacter sp. B11]
MPAWDNEARKPGAGHVFHNASPELFHRWAGAALGASARLARPDERLVFVNAWNEWAEGPIWNPTAGSAMPSARLCAPLSRPTRRACRPRAAAPTSCRDRPAAPRRWSCCISTIPT